MTSHSPNVPLPGQSWGGSTHWVGSGWRAWSHGSSRHWQSCTWRHRSPGTRLQSGPCHRWAWFSRPGRVQRAPPNTRRGVTPDSDPGPGASAPAPQAWAAAGSTVPPRTADCSPEEKGSVWVSALTKNVIRILKHVAWYYGSVYTNFYHLYQVNLNRFGLLGGFKVISLPFPGSSIPSLVN